MAEPMPHILYTSYVQWLMARVVKNPLASVGVARDVGLIPGSGRSPGVGNGNPLQYFLPGKFHRQRNLVGYSPWVCKELDMTECTHT